ncbi:MAG TPA: hypothetical protein VKB38_21125 [Terracidiphilus sp.]|nr:hypothetical protein [Terracidiphilus sp.]
MPNRPKNKKSQRALLAREAPADFARYTQNHPVPDQFQNPGTDGHQRCTHPAVNRGKHDKIHAMSTNSLTVYMLKPSGDSIAINRTIAVIGEDEGPYVVLVTDRDYEYDPSGQNQTIVFRESYSSINDARCEMDKQVTLSLKEDFIHNRMSMI